MARDREHQFAGGNARAVVDHADERQAAAGGGDLDARCAGVERVLDQFLHHARRTLDDLAGGDLVDHRFGKLADGHGGDYTGIRMAANRRKAQFTRCWRPGWSISLCNKTEGLGEVALDCDGIGCLATQADMAVRTDQIEGRLRDA